MLIHFYCNECIIQFHGNIFPLCVQVFRSSSITVVLKHLNMVYDSSIKINHFNVIKAKRWVMILGQIESQLHLLSSGSQAFWKRFITLFVKCLSLRISRILRSGMNLLDRTAASFILPMLTLAKALLKTLKTQKSKQKGNKAMLQLCFTIVSRVTGINEVSVGQLYSDLILRMANQILSLVLREIPPEQSTLGQNWIHKLLEIICSLEQTGRWRHSALNLVEQLFNPALCGECDVYLMQFSNPEY